MNFDPVYFSGRVQVMLRVDLTWPEVKYIFKSFIFKKKLVISYNICIFQSYNQYILHKYDNIFILIYLLNFIFLLLKFEDFILYNV